MHHLCKLGLGEELLVRSKLVEEVVAFPVPVCCTGSVRAEVVAGQASH